MLNILAIIGATSLIYIIVMAVIWLVRRRRSPDETTMEIGVGEGELDGKTLYILTFATPQERERFMAAAERGKSYE